MPSPELCSILGLVPADFADPAADYRAVRATMAPWHGGAVPAHIGVSEGQLGGVRCATYDDRRAPPRRRTVFHCHGGGLVSCPLDDYHFYGALLAEELEATVVLPDYRLAPEHPFPAAHDDCLDAYRGLLESGVDPSTIVVSGDSCGGLLALGALVSARDEGLPMPACFVSLSGWFDLAVTDPKPVQGDDPFLTAAWVRNRGRDYTGGAVALDDPGVSPAFAELAGLPLLYLPVAQYDTVYAGVLALAERAQRAGVPVIAESWPGMVHGWQGLATAKVPEAEAAFARARAVLAEAGA
ncbi:MAG TPA: alpha/beta hydrolase [Acidimicrobiales bacterium]|nr:alpha/beta hydrolase [Acidimicrobiales bacterium]